jgi:hypothetical protein
MILELQKYVLNKSYLFIYFIYLFSGSGDQTQGLILYHLSTVYNPKKYF